MACFNSEARSLIAAECGQLDTMERQNVPFPSPSQLAHGCYQTHQPPAMGYRRRSRSRERKHGVDDRSTPFANADPARKPQAVPRAIKPPRFPLLDASTDSDGALGEKRYNAAGETDDDEADGPIASSDVRHHRNHELYSQKHHGQPGGNPTQSPDKKGWQNHRADGTYQKIISLARPPRYRNAKHKAKPAERTAMQGKTANSIPSSSSPARSNDKLVYSHVRSADQQRREDRETGLGIEKPCRQKSYERADTGTDLSTPCSVSPMSEQSSSATEWESKYFMDIPSANEPNTPTTNWKQTPKFQPNIDSFLQYAEGTLDPKASPSSRSAASEEKLSLLLRQQQRQGTPNRYYSPEEVGKPKGSTTQQAWSPAPKGRSEGMNLDGSFLGCKVNNAPGDKNPDEILLFSPRVEHQNFADVAPIDPGARSGPMEPSHSMPHSLGQKTIVKDKRDAISRNLKHVLCSKLSPKASQLMKGQQPTNLNILNKTPKEEDLEPTGSLPDSHERWKTCQAEDDVFIITPTITRTLITVGYTDRDTRNTHGRQPRPLQANREVNRPRIDFIPSALQPMMQNSQEKSTPGSKISSKVDPIRSIPTAKSQASLGGVSLKHPQVTPGYIRTPGMVKSSSENFTASQRNNMIRSVAPVASWGGQNASLGRSTSDSSQSAKIYLFSDISPLESPTTSEPAVDDIIRKPGKVFELAELDGHEVDNRKPQQHPQSKIIDVAMDFPEFLSQGENGDDAGGITLPLVFDIFFLSVAQLLRLYGGYVTSPYVRTAVRSIFQAAENCFHILMWTWRGFWVYRTTGSWPKPRDKVFSHSMGSVSQCIINVAALGFFIVVLGRVAWYMVLVGSWVVWIARPFAWVFSIMGRMLLA